MHECEERGLLFLPCLLLGRLMMKHFDVTGISRSEEHTSELQSHSELVCRLLLEKKKKNKKISYSEKRHYVIGI